MAKPTDTLRGQRELDRAWAKIAKSVPLAAAMGLYALGFDIIALAVAKTPVDTGRLRASRYVAPPVLRGSTHVVELGFGTRYAAPVHERIDVAHSTGEAKFLQKAINEKASGALAFALGIAEKLIQRGAVSIPATQPERPAASNEEQ